MPLIGRPIPVSVAVLGLAFLACALFVAGLPPFSGFLAKVAILSAAVGSTAALSASTWALIGLLLLSGLFSTISLTRAGIRHFWSKGGRFAPGLKAAEAGAVVFLLGVAVSLSILAEPVMRYTAATARSLHAPRPYIDAVLGARAQSKTVSSDLLEPVP